MTLGEIAATEVIQDFAIIMVVASAMAIISYSLKQPMTPTKNG